MVLLVLLLLALPAQESREVLCPGAVCLVLRPGDHGANLASLPTDLEKAMKKPPIDDGALFKGFGSGTLTSVEDSWGPYLRQLRNDKGQSLLHVADRPETVAALLGLGLDPDARDHSGKTPLMRYRTAASNRLLLEAGAEVNALDPQGNAALDYQAGALDGCIGYVAPEFEPLDVLIAAGAEPPRGARARRWIENARAQVTAAVENNDCLRFERWIDEVGK